MGVFMIFAFFLTFDLLDFLVWSLQSGQGEGKKVFLTVKTATKP